MKSGIPFIAHYPHFGKKRARDRESMQPGEQNRKKTVIYTGVKKSFFLLKDPESQILSLIDSH